MRNRYLGTGLLAGLMLLLASAPVRAQRGAITLPRNLGELANQSAVILRGSVISATVEPAPGLGSLSSVVVTLQVREVLKGIANPTFTFRQFIWDVRDRSDAAGYRKGQDLLLLLNAPTKYGLVSPTGLEQGRFRILRDAQGREFAVNGLGNAGLFRDLAPQLQRKGIVLPEGLAALVSAPAPRALRLEDLRELIQRISGAK